MAYDSFYVVCDTETGGLPQNLKKEGFTEVALTEIAFVILDNRSLKVVDKASWLIKPYKDDLIYDPFAAKASGIDKSFCEENGIDLKTVGAEVKAFLKKYTKKKAYLVGQKFIEFDLDFVLPFFDHIGIDFNKWFSHDIKDTMVTSRDKWPHESKHNLAIICERLEIPYHDSHRALPDTEMTAKVWVEFMKSLRGLNEITKETKKEEKEETVKFEL